MWYIRVHCYVFQIDIAQPSRTATTTTKVSRCNHALRSFPDSRRHSARPGLLCDMAAAAGSQLHLHRTRWLFPMAVAFRCMGGVLNGNIGVMRTMISEIIKEKKYQSKAFLVLPMTFNIGVILGPILGKSSGNGP